MAEINNVIAEASQDLQTIEDFVNLPADSEVYPRLLPSVNVGTLAGTRQAIFEAGGLPATPFATKALMTASALVDGDYAMVTDDADDNGLYVKTAGAWVKSAYDPALLAKDYTDSKVKPAIINFTDRLTMQASSLPVGSFALVSGDDKNNGFYEKAISGWSKLQYNPQDKINTLGGIQADNIEDILRFEDSVGQAVYKVNSLGEHYFVGLENDLKTEMDVKTEHNPLPSNDIFNFKDADGITTFKQTVDGDLHGVNIGNITQTLKDSQNNIASIISDNKENAKASLETLGVYTAGKYYDRAHIDKSKTTNEIGFIMTPQEIDALGMYDYIVNVLRIPSMTRIAKNKFLIGFESRFNWADVGQTSSTTCIATVDEDTHAVSISHVNDIGSYFVDETEKWRAFMNPALVQLDDNKTVFSFILRRHERLEHELYMRKSTDNGKTWGAAIDISYVYNSNDWRLFLCNSNGFVKKYGKHKGRIIVPAFHSDAVYSSQYSRVLYIYSDDNGDTWELGEGLPWTDFVPSESNFVEDFNGDMFVSARIENYGVDKDTRLLARYVEKAGEYVQLPTPTGLNTEAAQGGLVRGDGKFDDSTAKIVACVNTYGLRNQPANVRRTGLTVGISYDAMLSWITYNVPELDLSHTGYMNVEFLDENHLFVVYEGDNTTIKYAIIPVANVLQQGVKL